MPLSTVFACLAMVVAAPQRKAGEDDAAHLALLSVSGWPELVERDRRATFGLRTIASAQREVERAEASDRERAAALVALGCAKSVADRSRILALADEGKGDLKTAAIWALGALASPTDVPKLVELTGRRAAVAQAGVFALALNGTREAVLHLRSLSSDGANPLSGHARDALGYAAAPPQESDAARAFLDLRFEAARRHGLVDGQAWDVLLLHDLAQNQKFVGRVVYRAASEVRRHGVRDHFLEIALAGTPPERLRGVVHAIPSELSQLIESELFTPADANEWRILVDEIARRHLESLTEPILRRAFTVEGLRAASAAALARGGAKGALAVLDLHLRSEDPSERRAAGEALGASGDESYLPTLSGLEDDEDASVRATALVGRVQLGDESALLRIRSTFQLDAAKPKLGELAPEAPPLLDALLRAAGDSRLRSLVRELMPRVPEGMRARFAIELALAGDEDSKPAVRAFLQREPPRGEVGVRAVAAIGREPRAADLALLRSLFPLGDDLEIDVEMACALLAARDPEVTPILRAALWSEPWNRSVLAGALWIDVAGIDGLRGELQRPPAGASARDLRRVGFALGEWGGVAEVEWLSARVGAADPGLQGAVLGAMGARTH